MSLTQQTRTYLFAFVLLGLGASLMSLAIHYRILSDPAYSSFCNFDRAFNCDAAYRSRFGTFDGVPLALFGVIWFTLALLLTLAADTKAGPTESGAVMYLFVTSTAALSVMLYLAYVSVVVLNTACILCVLTGLAVLGVFLISGVATNRPLGGLPRQAVRDTRALAAKPLALTLALVFVAAAISAVAFFSLAVKEPTAAALAAVLTDQPTDFDIWFESKMRVPIVLPTDDAPVLIVKFTDYQCPSCAETYKTHGVVFAKYQATQPGKVKLVLKDYPLERECNPNAAAVGHLAACEGAAAVRLADRRQRRPAMEEWLYTHQVGLTPAAVRQAAKEVGGVSDFDEEYPRILALIQSDVELGHRLGVTAAPTFFINGVRIEGEMEPQVLDQAIAHELKVTAAKP